MVHFYTEAMDWFFFVFFIWGVGGVVKDVVTHSTVTATVCADKLINAVYYSYYYSVKVTRHVIIEKSLNRVQKNYSVLLI